jgi:uncharacterized protein
MHLKLSQYQVATPVFFDEEDQRTKQIVFATRTGEMRVVDSGTWALATEGAFDRLGEANVADFIAAKILVAADEDELKTVLSGNDEAARSLDTLSLVIMPSAYCQMGCVYCGQEHKRSWMNEKNQDAVLGRARSKLESGRYRHLEVSWFGGEPLSGIGVMRSLTARLKALAAEHGCGYSASITTNGLQLSHELATELIETHNISSFTVSLDGVAEHHDLRRPRKNGQGTFERIFANVVNLASRDDERITIKLRCNVDSGNCDSVRDLLRMLAEAGVQNRLSWYAAPIHSWGNDAHRRSLDPADFAAREIEWFCEMIRLGFKIGFIPMPKPVVCVAVQPEGDVVDAGGNLFACTEAPYVPSYGEPNKYSIGHVATGETNGGRAVFADFNSRVARGEYGCSTCRMLPVCGGACPKAWQDGHEPCPSAKRNIEQRLLLAYAASRLPSGAH